MFFLSKFYQILLLIIIKFFYFGVPTQIFLVLSQFRIWVCIRNGRKILILTNLSLDDLIFRRTDLDELILEEFTCHRFNILPQNASMHSGPYLHNKRISILHWIRPFIPISRGFCRTKYGVKDFNILLSNGWATEKILVFDRSTVSRFLR